MIDFHTHILPGMDDGARSLEESLELLRMERSMGIRTVLLTSHFYAGQNSPREFLERRQQAWELLRNAVDADMPRLLPGAEVQFFENILNVDSIRSLCITGTNLLLLEMPFEHWDERTLRVVEELNACSGMQVVLAHIERYLDYQPARSVDRLRNSGVLMQVNASFFSGWFRRRRALKMLKDDEIQLIGSDCHNLGGRKPNWNLVPAEAMAIAGKNAAALLQKSIV